MYKIATNSLLYRDLYFQPLKHLIPANIHKVPTIRCVEINFPARFLEWMPKLRRLAKRITSENKRQGHMTFKGAKKTKQGTQPLQAHYDTFKERCSSQLLSALIYPSLVPWPMLVDFPANRGLFSPVIRWDKQEENRSLPTVATVFDLKRRPRSWTATTAHVL